MNDEHRFDPEHDPIARRLAALAAGDTAARNAMEAWKSGRLSRSEALMLAVESLAARVFAVERTDRLRANHTMDDDDESE